MSQPQIRYGIDDRPPPMALLHFALQWLAVMAVSAVIMGKAVAALHYSDPVAQLLYLQKLLFLMGSTLALQLTLGHRLPLVVGPAVILLVGIGASGSEDIAAIYTSSMAGAAALSLLCGLGLFQHVARLFTPRVVACILVLIALTITPTILSLILDAPSPRQAAAQLPFALLLFLAILLGERLLTGLWRSTVLVWALIGGSVLGLVLFPAPAAEGAGSLPLFSFIFKDCTTALRWDPGLLLSFCICFIALAINDLGSIESMGKLLQPPAMERRLGRGMLLTGLSNVLAGFLGVIGLVNYSLSAGIIASSGNASRISFLPAAGIMLVVAFMPPVAALAWQVPAVVVGVLLLHIMSLQLAAGLTVAFAIRGFTFQDALIISIPIMVSVLVAYLPREVVAHFPALLIPVLGNGFVMGTLAVLLLEHLLFRSGGAGPKPSP